MTNQSPSWQASQDRFLRTNKLWTRHDHRIHAGKTDFGQVILRPLVLELVAFLDGKKLDRDGQPILPLSPPDDMGPALFSLGTENLALATLAPLVDGIMRGWSPGPDRRRKVCERIGRFLADTHKAFEDSSRVARIQAGNWLLDAAMTLDAFDLDAAGYPAWCSRTSMIIGLISMPVTSLTPKRRWDSTSRPPPTPITAPVFRFGMA
jgi:hypothetical protein